MKNRSAESSGFDPQPPEGPHLRLVTEENSKTPQDHPHFVSPEELQAIYDPELTSDERLRINDYLQLFAEPSVRSERLGEIRDRLISRSGEKMLPVDDKDRKSFIFRRANQVEKADKKHLIKLLSKRFAPQDLQDLAAFLLREKRKTDWLEANTYPEMFARAVAQAKGDVQQFLLKEVNNPDAMREQFADLDRISVHFQDDIQFVLQTSEFPIPAGQFSASEQKITAVVPPYFEMSDEQEVYQVLVHEYVHSISDRSKGKIALRTQEHIGLNESLTEVIAYQIANEHREKSKAALQRRSTRKPNRYDSGYAQYIQRFEMILKKIPKRLFVDALLAPDGVHVLEETFADVFQGEVTLASFTKFVEEGKSMRTAREKPKLLDSE